MNIGIENRSSSVSYQPQPGYPPQSPIGYQPPPIAYQQPPPIGYPPPQPAYPTPSNQVSNTTVVIQQPQTQIVVQKSQPWSTDLCSCCDDTSLCLLGLFCPCILPCVVSVKANECCCVGSLCPVALRASIRERYNIEGNICNDCCVLHYCGLCAFCQMGRELDNQK